MAHVTGNPIPLILPIISFYPGTLSFIFCTALWNLCYAQAGAPYSCPGCLLLLCSVTEILWVSSEISEIGLLRCRMTISKGDPVEVCSHEEGFSGAWFPATVVKKHGARFLVEFRDLMTEDEKSMLREMADASQIRPTPPLLNSDRFALHQEVDVYDQDGWWVGVVTQVLDNNMYTVYFRESIQEKIYCASQLRAHQEWVNGKWVQASEHPKSLPSCSEKLDDTSSKPVQRSTRVNRRTRKTMFCKGRGEEDIDNEGLPIGRSQLAPKSSKRRQRTRGQLNNITSIKNKEGLETKDIENFQKAHASDSSVLDGETITVTIPYLEDIQQGADKQGNRRLLQGKASLRQLELLAYHYVLQVLYVQRAHSWVHEVLLTNLREVLHISNKEHANELKHIISDQYN